MRISDWSSDVCSSDLRSSTHTISARRSCDRNLSSTPHASVWAVRHDGGWLGVPARALAPRVRSAAGQTHLRNDGARRQCGLEFRQTKRSEEHTSELQSLMRISYAVFC